MWILLKQETVSGSGISWAICKSASHPRQINTPAPHQFFTGRMPFLLPNQQHQSTEGKRAKLLNNTWQTSTVASIIMLIMDYNETLPKSDVANIILVS